MTTWFPEEHKKREIEKHKYFYGIEMLTKEQILEKAKSFSIDYQGVEIFNKKSYLRFLFPKRIGYLKNKGEYDTEDYRYYTLLDLKPGMGVLPGNVEEKQAKIVLSDADSSVLHNTDSSEGFNGDYLTVYYPNWLLNPSIEFRTTMNDTIVRLGLENIKNQYFQSLIFEYLQVVKKSATLNGNELHVGVVMDYIKENFLNV